MHSDYSEPPFKQITSDHEKLVVFTGFSNKNMVITTWWLYDEVPLLIFLDTCQVGHTQSTFLPPSQL